MLKRKNLAKVLCLIIMCFAFMNCSFADDEIKKENASYTDITKGIEYIRQNITYINSRITQMKNNDLYNTYPAVRLNVETPIFGINSVVEKKLAIKNDVSTTDIISGYSIYDIIRTNKVKVPSLSVGSVIVSTREVEISKNMSDSDASAVIKVIYNSMKQSDEVKKFVDDYIKKNLGDYVDSDIKLRVEKVNSQCDSIFIQLKNVEDKLLVLKYADEEKYNEYIKTYSEVFDLVYQIKEESKDVLITKEKLSKLENKLDEIFKKERTLIINIKATYNLLNVEKSKQSSCFIEQSENMLSEVMMYLTNSFEYISVEDLKQKNKENDFSADLITEEIDVYICRYYPITSETSINVIEENIKKEKEAYLKILEIKSRENADISKIDEYADEIINCYKNIMLESKNFYNANYKCIMDSINEKTKSIIDYTDENVSNEYLLYNVYDLNKIDEMCNKYNGDSYFESMKLYSYFKSNMKNIKSSYSKVNTVYNRLTRAGVIS